MPKKVKRDAALKAAKKEKQAMKFAKKKMKQNLNDDEEDIDDIVARLPSSTLAADSKSAVVVSCNTQPTARAHSSFTLLSSGEFFLFGGEIFDGQRTQVYNETYRWNIDRSEWRRVESPVMPKPRCSHQAISYKDGVYIFGGEFSTSEQFYHYRDLWHFDLKSNLWEEIKGTGTSPSARSGHRVVVWRNLMVLFGGFYDTLKETRYLNDLYLFSFADRRWTKVEYKPQQQVPPCRSGCVLAVHPSGEYIFMTGGYAKVKDTGRNAVGMYYDDSWLLNMRGLMKGASTTSSTAMPVWEKLKKKGKWPTVRSGSSMIVHKNLALLFGGVHDDDEGGMTLRSVFYNDLYAFDMDRKRWYAYSLKSARTGGKGKSRKTKEMKGNGGGEAKRGIKREDDEEERKNNSDDDDGDLEDLEDLDYQENTFGYIDQDGKLVRIAVDEEEMEGNELMPHLPYEEKEEEEQSKGWEGKEEKEMEMMSSPSISKNEEMTEIMNNSSTSTSSLISDSNSSSRDSSTSNNKIDGTSSSDSSSTKINSRDCSSNIKMNNTSTTIGSDSCIMNLKSNRSDTNKPTSTANSNNASGNNNGSGVITNSSPSRCPSSDGALVLPLPRINAGLCVRGNQLYLYGGLVEIGSKELTLDDCWCLNLNTRQQWVCLLKGRMEHQIWKEDENEEEGEEEDEEEEEGSDECSLSSEEEEEEGGKSSSESEEEDEEKIVENNVDRNKRKRNTSEDKEREAAFSSSLASAAAPVGMTSAVSAAGAAASGSHSFSSSSSIANLLGSLMTTNAEGYQELSSFKKKANIVKAKSGGGEKEELSVKLRDEMKHLRDLLGLENVEQTPQAGEALRDFFDRTKLFWMKKVEEGNYKISMEFDGDERKAEEEQTVEEKEEERDEKETKEKEKKMEGSGRQEQGHGKKSSNTKVNRIDLKESKKVAFSFAEKRYEIFVPHLKRLKELEDLQQQEEEGQEKDENIFPNKKKGKVKKERVDGKGSNKH